MTAVSRLLLVALALLLVCVGCPKKEETIIHTADGKELTAEEIDREPLALLPGGAVGLGYVDAKQLFASQFGQKLLELTRKVAPLPASTGFEPKRDLERVYWGLYSMAGVDFAAVAIGKFDQEAIERAAERADRTPQGVPIVKSSYAKRTLYTAQNLGFVVLTEKTLLFGNETGIRRALDRISEGRVERRVPAWVEELFDEPNAAMAGGLDLGAQPVTDATRQQLPFLDGLRTVRTVGNFQPPGINVAGTASYDDAEAAKRGEASVQELYQTLQNLGLISWLVGIPQPIKQLEAQAQGKDLMFVTGVDAQAVGVLLDRLAASLPAAASGAPAPAGGG